MMIPFMVLILVALYCVYWVLVVSPLPPNFPPGPRLGLPLLGHSLSLRHGLAPLRKRYGHIFGLLCGPLRTVYVSDFDLLQQVTSSPHFVDKLQYPLIHRMRGGTVDSGGRPSAPAIVHGQGPSWEEQRRFALHTLKDLGFGKVSMEGLIHEEVAKLCRRLERLDGAAVDAAHLFGPAVLNSLWVLVAGARLDGTDDPRLAEVFGLIGAMTGEKGDSIARHILNGRIFAYLACRFEIAVEIKAFFRLRELIREVIAEHRASFQEETPRDFLDRYLDEMRRRSRLGQKSSFAGGDGEKNLENLVTDLFLAGLDTSAAMMVWAMVFMINNPGVTRKLQAELDAVTGRSRLPSTKDKDRTPYTEAFIHELHRSATLTPRIFNIVLSGDLSLMNGKYLLPGGTRVVLDIGSIMKNPAEFPDPDVFRPERFLSPDGLHFRPHPHVIPFGQGKRRCVGETLAKMTLYLFVTAIASRFTPEKQHPSQHVSERATTGTMAKPYPFKMRFRPRD